jgi:hypothetical protein
LASISTPPQLDNLLLRTDASRPWGFTCKVRGPLLATHLVDAACARCQLCAHGHRNPTHPHWVGAHDPRLQTAVRCLQTQNPKIPSIHRIAPAPQLADFGLSEVMPDADTRATPSDHAGSHPGTLTHMAPELLRVRPGAVDNAAAADAYAFGVAIWELWTGCRAFEGAPHSSALVVPASWRPSALRGTWSVMLSIRLIFYLLRT